jgi:hypothetical protein
VSVTTLRSRRWARPKDRRLVRRESETASGMRMHTGRPRSSYVCRRARPCSCNWMVLWSATRSLAREGRKLEKMDLSLKQSTVLPESSMAEAYIQPYAGGGRPAPGRVVGWAGSSVSCMCGKGGGEAAVTFCPEMAATRANAVAKTRLLDRGLGADL